MGPFANISVDQAKALLDKGGVDLIDVRELHEWQGGHLPGARHIPLGTFLRAAADHLSQDNVVFVCAHGRRSETAAVAAAAAGMKQLYSIDGGTVAWAKAGLPIER